MAQDMILLRNQTFKLIELELACYFDTKKEIELTRLSIIYPSTQTDENIGGGKSNVIRRPTEETATALDANRMLRNMETVVNAIETIYERLPDEKKMLIKLRYWTHHQKFDWEGVGMKLNCTGRTARRWRDEIVIAIAMQLGWR